MLKKKYYKYSFSKLISRVQKEIEQKEPTLTELREELNNGKG